MEITIKTKYSVGDHLWRLVDKKPAEFIVRALRINSRVNDERQRASIQYELHSVEKVDKSADGSMFYMMITPLESDLEGKYFTSKADLVTAITRSLMN